MPYRTFFDWCFDGDIKTPIPQGEGIPDILKYNSPIHATFLLKSFIKHGKLNFYLNRYLNNIGVRYIDRADLFKFFKQCVIDFKFNRRDIHYVQWTKHDVLFNALRKKYPLLKNYEIKTLCEIINGSPEKDIILRSLGIEKKPYDKKKKRKKATQKKISAKNFIAQYFNLV